MRRVTVLAEVEQVTAVVLLLALVLGHLVRGRVRVGVGVGVGVRVRVRVRSGTRAPGWG